MLQFSKSTMIQVFAIALAFFAVTVAAESIPPPTFPEEITAPPTLRFKPASRLTMGKFIARFEITTLSQVIKATGLGSISHQGDAGGSLYWLCYMIPSEETFQRVWIIAHGEMGGREHKITEVIATRLSADTKPSDACPDIPTLLQPMSLDRGIWIDSRVPQLIKALGQPSEFKNDWLVYLYEGTKPGKYQGKLVQFDESSFLEMRVEIGKVTTLRAAKVTSY